MTYVKRANVVLEIDENNIQHYLELGYNVIDDKGNIIVPAIPNDLGELRRFYVEAKAEIEKLNARIAELEESSRKRNKKSTD